MSLLVLFIHVCFVYLCRVFVPHHHPRYLHTCQYIRYCDGYLDQRWWLLKTNNSSNVTRGKVISLYPVLSINCVTRLSPEFLPILERHNAGRRAPRDRDDRYLG